MKKVFCVFAHREDHIVAGWPIMQNDKYEKHVFICTNDHERPVQKSINECAASVYRHNFPNGFTYRTKIRTANYDRIESILLAKVAEKKPDYIFVHNPWGEYGHFDHRTMFSMVLENFSDKKILFTDIISRSSYYPRMTRIPPEYEHLCGDVFSTVEMDTDFYEKHGRIFAAADAWTKNENLNIPAYQSTARVFVLNRKKINKKPPIEKREEDALDNRDAEL